jgi:hypothetical protein
MERSPSVGYKRSELPRKWRYQKRRIGNKE